MSQLTSSTDSHDSEEEDEKKYSTGAPLRRIDFETYLQYEEMIINDTYHHYYVTSDWTPQFYSVLARAGFISVAQDEYLIPEIQTYYCILDFPSLHIPRKAKKICRRYLTSKVSKVPTAPTSTASSESDAHTTSMRLRMFANKDPDLCIRKIQEYWGEMNWLNDRYVSCLKASGLEIYTFELYLEAGQWDSEENRMRYRYSLLAGEVGYVIGSVYTSLTGFHVGGCPEAPRTNGEKGGTTEECEDETSKNNEQLKLSIDHVSYHSPTTATSEPNPSHSSQPPLLLPKDLARCCGTVQLCALGYWLNMTGFSFWNLGHPPRKKAMKYKRDLGGAVYSRRDFLQRWHVSTSLPSPSPMQDITEKRSCEIDVNSCFL